MCAPSQPHFTRLTFYAVLFWRLVPPVIILISCIPEFLPLLGPWDGFVAWHTELTFDRHLHKLDFLSPVTCSGAKHPCQANYGSFVIKTLWWWWRHAFFAPHTNRA